jgi:hypothetical protein
MVVTATRRHTGETHLALGKRRKQGQSGEARPRPFPIISLISLSTLILVKTVISFVRVLLSERGQLGPLIRGAVSVCVPERVTGQLLASVPLLPPEVQREALSAALAVELTIERGRDDWLVCDLIDRLSERDRIVDCLVLLPRVHWESERLDELRTLLPRCADAGVLTEALRIAYSLKLSYTRNAAVAAIAEFRDETDRRHLISEAMAYAAAQADETNRSSGCLHS